MKNVVCGSNCVGELAAPTLQKELIPVLYY